MDATPSFRTDGDDRRSTPPDSRPERGRTTAGAAASTPDGYACPTCGGLLRKHRDGGGPAFACEIGHRFEALELWVTQCTARNIALGVAARALAETAALARALAARSRERGDLFAAARLDTEAEFEERSLRQVWRMLEGLEPSGPGPARPPSAG